MNTTVIVALLCMFGVLCPVPDRLQQSYHYRVIKKNCLALIVEDNGYQLVCKCIIALNTPLADRVLRDLVKEGMMPKKYLTELVAPNDCMHN